MGLTACLPPEEPQGNTLKGPQRKTTDKSGLVEWSCIMIFQPVHFYPSNNYPGYDSRGMRKQGAGNYA